MNNTKAALKQHGTAQRSRRSAAPAAHTTAKAKAQQQPKTEAKAVGYYPNYMRKQRKVLTPGELKRADAIRQHLTALAHQDGYGVTYYTDSRGRDMARIGRTDGQGVGFMLTAQQAREWLQQPPFGT